MTDQQAGWMKGLVGPLRVKPGSAVDLPREEQRRRFLRRIGHPEKNWKFSAADVRERRYWDDYQHA